MRNKIILGTGIIATIAGISGLFAADHLKKNNKLVTVVSGIVAIIGLGLAALVLDDELYPEDLEEDENKEETSEEDGGLFKVV